MTASRARVDRIAELEALYAELPVIECRGKCWDSCGRLPLLRIEQRRIRDESGVDIPDGTKSKVPAVCPALGIFNQCTVYDSRPLICRLWGLVDNLACNFGCVPEGGRLSVAEGYELLARGAEIDGQYDTAAMIRASFATPELAARSTVIAMALIEERHTEYAVMESRARKAGTALYVHGRSGLSRDPIGPGRGAP
jgi:hypothetical protein